MLKLGGTGFAVGATTATFAGWPITTAVGIVTELGVAGATKQAVLEEYRGEDRIADARLETIDPSFEKTVANMKIDDVMEHAVNVSVDNLKDVSIERQDALRKKVRSSLGKYGVGFAWVVLLVNLLATGLTLHTLLELRVMLMHLHNLVVIQYHSLATNLL